MRFSDQQASAFESVDGLDDLYLADEQQLVRQLVDEADPGNAGRRAIHDIAVTLVRSVREKSAGDGGIDAFLQQYDLSSEEGVLLMCIAEALLRIPDADTADKLISDKITSANWKEHLGESDSLFVNASTWGLMLTGQILKFDDVRGGNPVQALGKLATRAGEPVVRTAMRQAMKIMGHQFVMGRTIREAMKRSVSKGNARYRYSYDMLGEAALTATDAERYFEAYHDAISEIGSRASASSDMFSADSISVKLSALHPRYDHAHGERVMKELAPRLRELAVHAKEQGIALTMDAEEAERLAPSLAVFRAVLRDPQLAGYDGLGLAVQTYQRRAGNVIRFVADLAKDTGRRIPTRLVKGAYWDTEIKHAQELGLASYPVFTRKTHTDVSYLACSRRALGAGKHLYPQFATHNAHTIASIMQYAGERRDYEFQRLHGMGEALYEQVIDPDRYGRPCRVYAPVGSHEDLLPYLVRRLLENGANTSFVNRIIDEAVPVDDIVSDPIEAAHVTEATPHPGIVPPAELFADERRNSRGINIADSVERAALIDSMQAATGKVRQARPIVDGRAVDGETVSLHDPSDTRRVVGDVVQSTADDVDRALSAAHAGQRAWDAVGAETRAAVLDRAADLFEENGPELMALCIEEAGKSIPDAIAELREAVDFLRFYAAEARRLFAAPTELPGPTGERNQLGLRGKGVFVCISPWNFPLAIYTGQVAAALAAGNTVLAKPAEQTPIVASRASALLFEAGVPADVLHFLPGDGATVGGRAVADARTAGVAFTGSTETAQLINRTLAARDGAIATFIAETGGQNAMFVDSSALPEQVVLDAVYSAFNSAGQRCSALRLLCLQDDIAPRIIELLKGSMDELAVGDPAKLATDVGPAIDEDARALLEAHVERMGQEARILHRAPLGDDASQGSFFAPTLIEIERIDQLEREVFGPILHVLRFRAKDLQATIDAVNATGYGLTMGVHSRIDSRTRKIAELSAAGNVYINRNMIGAVVGVQPFGGRGLSGTGPKAGGPHYLARFGSEYTISNNIAAVGGNASLLSLATD
ncbi:MAG: bifunctional proline dehydrogenase/L-glutamate gamma-semialdehyde dehydrogenase PutA [Pseudomonadota bacterium]